MYTKIKRTIFKSVLCTLVVLSNSSCAFFGSEEYYSVKSKVGEVDWYASKLWNITGKPDAIRYRKDDLNIDVYTSKNKNDVYTFGPCIILPLPILPAFSFLDKDLSNGIEIIINPTNYIKNYRLTKVELTIDDEILRPSKIKIYHSKDKEYIFEEMTLPTYIDDKWSSFHFSYSVNTQLVNDFELLIFIEDNEGKEFLKDNLYFFKDESTYLSCWI